MVSRFFVFVFFFATVSVVAYHPADLDQNAHISEAELDTYSLIWRHGLNWPNPSGQMISVNQVTLAAKIVWDYGGYYDPNSSSSSGIMVIDFGGLIEPYYLYQPARVRIFSNPPGQWTACAYEEILPVGYGAEVYQEIARGDLEAVEDYREDLNLADITITQLSGQTVVRAGPFKKGYAPVQYALVLNDRELPTNADFLGWQSYDGVVRYTNFRHIRNSILREYPSKNDWGVYDDYADIRMPDVDLAADENNDGVSNLQSWLATGNPSKSYAGFEPRVMPSSEVDNHSVSIVFYRTVESKFVDEYFLWSPNMKYWIATPVDHLVRKRSLDKGSAMAYKAIISRNTESETAYYRMMAREYFPRTWVPSTYSYVTPYRQFQQDYQGSLSNILLVLLSISNDQFEMEVAAPKSVMFDVEGVNIETVNGDPVSPERYVKISPSGNGPIVVRRESDEVSVTGGPYTLQIDSGSVKQFTLPVEPAQ
ncbi:hypothetical protein [Cerasicoccus fimbriatus]|uniref:hypothetical protein n=1 Tax=Cerasicoccus fimbriatus TaxID=3014554 RepID=UPI0022B5A0F8|nr:hypothetical protein [Cerasicoccus sp. TK19100]